MSEGDRDKPCLASPEASETQELPRIRTPRLAAELLIEGADPWTDVTPHSIEGEILPAPARHSSVSRDEDLPYTEDGPFAAPVDAPRRALARFSSSGLGLPAVDGASLPSDIVMRRKVPSRGPSGETVAALAHARRPEARPVDPVRQAPGLARRYPKMRALLQNPDKVPYGLGGRRPAQPPRRERVAPPRPATPPDLDRMLATMADGLLIGEDGSGHTEVRVTLRDEFFAGTELRIRMGDDGVTALLVPPNRSTYLTLNGNVDDLRMRLEARGLRVTEVRVAEP